MVVEKVDFSGPEMQGKSSTSPPSAMVVEK
jgi:hypothetical protein